MHSTIFLISKDQNEEPYFGYTELDSVQHVNPCADYVGDLHDDEDMEHLILHLSDIFPDFIHVDVKNRTIKVDDNLDCYEAWMQEHICRVREWQDRRMAVMGVSAYHLKEVNIVTESDNKEEWENIHSIFFFTDSGETDGYLDFIENLTYFAGETLYIIGGCDYHW